MQTVGSVISSYFARYKLSSYSVGNRVACNILFPWEFLRPLLKGGAVYVILDDVVFVPRALARFISEHRISEILFTPSLLQGVLNSADLGAPREQLSSLRVVRLNGEVVPVSLVKLALDVLPESARVFNTYSISETHDVCTIELTDLCLDGMDTCPAVRAWHVVTWVGPIWIPAVSFFGMAAGITLRATWPRSRRMAWPRSLAGPIRWSR